MSLQNLSITLVQSALHWENVELNLNMFGHKISAIKKTDVILLPEMFGTGFSMQPEKFAEPMEGKTMKWMKAMAELTGAAICGSVMVEDNGKYYNRMVWMLPGGNYFTYNKRHLFRMGAENEHYIPGTERITVEWKGWKICPLVCYDLRFPVWSRNTDEYDLLIYVANWPAKRIYAWQSLLVARAIENQCYTIGLNRVGVDGKGVEHNGHSMLVDMNGAILFDGANSDTEHTVVLNKKELTQYREDFPVLRDRDMFKLK